MMKFNPKMRVRQVAGENIVMRMGLGETDMTTVMALNESTMMLYERLRDRSFTTDDAVALLCEEYDIDAETARHDVEEWMADMRRYDLIIDA